VNVKSSVKTSIFIASGGFRGGKRGANAEVGMATKFWGALLMPAAEPPFLNF